MIRRWLHPALRAAGVPPCGTHIFRRFRLTWLRENQVPADIERYWLGHADRSVGDMYSMLKRNVVLRKQIAERIGIGFKLTQVALQPGCTECTELAAEQAALISQ